MEIALIPPFSRLDDTYGRRYQMILPECWKTTIYRQVVRNNTSTYRILDNGMFETKGMDPESLINLAIEVGAHEIVMPDVREDMEGTLSAVSKFLDVFELSHFPSGTPNLMLVVQVNSMEHIPAFLAQAAWLEGRYFGARKFVYGIPRRFVERFGPEARLHIVNWIRQVSPESAIHLLGFGRTFMSATSFNEVFALRHEVRSLDTDAPYVWSYMGLDLQADPCLKSERPDRYFTYDVQAFPVPLLYLNMRTLDRWAHVGS